MRIRKYLATLLALCLLLALIPAATTEVVEVGDGDPAPEVLAEEAWDVAEEPSEGDEAIDAQPLEDVDLGGPTEYEIDAPGVDGLGDAASNPATESIVRITRPADGATVTVGEVELWCAFTYTGLNSSDYVPMDVQVLKNGKLVSEQFLTYGEIKFTDEGQKYGTILLETAGTYTIRVSVRGNAAGVWHSVTVTAEGTSATPAPATTRQPVTGKNPIVITSPEQGAKVLASGFPVRVKFQPGVLQDVSAYQPIYTEILNSDGDVVSGGESSGNYYEEMAASGEEWTLTTFDLEVGGNYTIRARVGESQVWDSVQVYAIGPAYPVSEECAGYTCVPKQDEVTINLGEDVGIGYTLSTDDDPDEHYAYYSEYVEDGEKTIRFCKGMCGGTSFAYDSAKGAWTKEGQIGYTGVKVGTTTLHMYITVDGKRYSHHAVTVHVVEKPKVTPTPTPTAAPKVKLSKCTIGAVKDQVYSGKAKTPAVTVKYGKKTLKKGTDYTVSYKNNKAIGTATVTLTGKGGYTGTKKATFRIVPQGTALTKVTAGTKSFTAKWKARKDITGYELQYGLKSDFSDATTVRVTKAATASRTVKKLKAKQKYYVRVRTYKTVGKVKYYSAWTKAKAVKTK